MNISTQFASFIRSGALLTVGAVVQAVGGLAGQLILMRLLTPEDFGYFALMYATAALVQMVLSLRLNVLIVRARDEDLTEERRDRYRAALMWETIVSAALVVLWLAAFGHLSVPSLLLVAAIAFGHWTSQSIAFSERNLRYVPIALVETGSQLMGYAVAVVLVLAGVGAIALYLRELVASVLRFAVFLSKGMVPFPLLRSVRGDEWRSLFREARGLWAEGLIEAAFQRFIVLCGGAIGGVAGAGIFAQAHRMALIPHQILAPLVGRLVPVTLVRVADLAIRRRLLWRAVAVLGGFLALIAVAIVLFAPPLVPWVFGPQWSDTAAVLVALAPFVVFYSCAEMLRSHGLNLHLARPIIAIKLVQYAVFGAGALAAWMEPTGGALYVLALGLSISYVVVFALTTVLLEWRAAKEGAK